MTLTLPRTPYPVTITCTATNTWAVTEVFAEQQVSHGFLTLKNGAFSIKTTAGTRKHYQSWQHAIIDELRRG